MTRSATHLIVAESAGLLWEQWIDERGLAVVDVRDDASCAVSWKRALLTATARRRGTRRAVLWPLK